MGLLEALAGSGLEHLPEGDAGIVLLRSIWGRDADRTEMAWIYHDGVVGSLKSVVAPYRSFLVTRAEPGVAESVAAKCPKGPVVRR